MPGYVESYVERRVAQAYQMLLERFPEAEKMPGLKLVTVPRRITARPDFRPMMRLVATELRQLFSGEGGRQMAVVLALSDKQTIVLTVQEDKERHIQYGIDHLGPYKLFFLKKLPFRRKQEPVLVRISFEELCLRVGDAKQVYRTVYVLVAVALRCHPGTG